MINTLSEMEPASNLSAPRTLQIYFRLRVQWEIAPSLSKKKKKEKKIQIVLLPSQIRFYYIEKQDPPEFRYNT